MSKYLFLDFDGVLNSQEFAKKEGKILLGLDPEAVQLLTLLIDNIQDLKIVISSTWRLGKSTEELQEILISKGGDERLRKIIVGQTPQHEDSWRSREIQEVLDALTDCDNYVVLDDDAWDIMDMHKNHFVKTNFVEGLTRVHIKQIIEKLNE